MPDDKTTKVPETAAPDTGPGKPPEQAPVKEPVKTEPTTPEQKPPEQAADKAAPPKDKPDTASCNPIPPIRSSAVGQNHHQEPNLPNLMAKPVDKARRIRYNFYGIFG